MEATMTTPEQDALAEKLKNKGNDQFKLNNFEKAIELYSEAIETKNSEPAYYTNRAIANLRVGNFQKAKDDCMAALRIDTKFSKAYNRLSKCNIALGELGDASVNLSKSIDLDPKNAVNKKDLKALNDMKITQTLIDRFYEEGKFEKAVTNLTELLKECKLSINHMCLKIECLLKSYQFAEANKYSAEIMKESDVFANNPRILCWRGKVIYYNGGEILGKKHFQQALNFDPDLAECQKCIKLMKKSNTMKEEAAAVFKAGELEKAITMFEECLELDDLNATYNATILLNISIAQVKLKANDLAITALNKALMYNPKYAKAYVKRGEILVSIEEYAEAIKDFGEASSIDSTGFGVESKLKDAQKKLKAAARKDYYKILGISDKNCSYADIKKAYKKSALKWHPDKNSESPEQQKKAEKMFKEVNEAMNVIGDKEKRHKYDQGGDPDEILQGRDGHSHGGGGMGGMDPNDLFAMFMGGGMGGGGGHSRGSRGGGGMPGGFNMGQQGAGQSFSFKFG